jgi:hypothetical protein
MQTLLIFVLSMVVIFGLVLTLSSLRGLEKESPYLPPLLCAELLSAWTLWSTYYYVRDERSDPVGLMRYGILLSLFSLLWGGGIGSLLSLSLYLWRQRQRFPGMIFVLLSFLVAFITVPVLFFMLMSRSDWSD